MLNAKLEYKYEHQNDAIEWKLPGSGQSKEDCGSVFWIGHNINQEKLHFKKAHKSCFRRECPVCYPDWIHRESIRAYDRLSKWIELHSNKIVHYVVSPPQDFDVSTRRKYQELKKLMYKIARKSGIRGGLVVFHQRAIRYSELGHYEDEHEGNQGPHFHILGDGWINPGQFTKGWIVKNLHFREKSGIIGTIEYLLGHVSIGYPAIQQTTVPGSDRPEWTIHTVTWFGNMSYNVLKVPKFTGSSTIFCPICKAEVPKTEWWIIEWLHEISDRPGSEYGESDANNWLPAYRKDDWTKGF